MKNTLYTDQEPQSRRKHLLETAAEKANQAATRQTGQPPKREEQPAEELKPKTEET